MTRVEISLYTELARHFKVSKEYVKNKINTHIQNVKLETGVEKSSFVELDLDNLGSITVGTSENEFPLIKFMFFDKFKKSDLYLDFKNAFNNDGADFIVFRVSSYLFCATEAVEYSGVGGILSTDGKGEGYVIQPLANLLKEKYPIYTDD